jgi:hypothetical protein
LSKFALDKMEIFCKLESFKREEAHFPRREEASYGDPEV